MRNRTPGTASTAAGTVKNPVTSAAAVAAVRPPAQASVRRFRAALPISAAGQRGQGDGHQAQAERSPPGQGLRRTGKLGPDRRDKIPGKPGEDDAAHPFQRRPGGSQRQYAPDAARRRPPCDAGRNGDRRREHGAEAEDVERDHPGKPAGQHSDGERDPERQHKCRRRRQRRAIDGRSACGRPAARPARRPQWPPPGKPDQSGDEQQISVARSPGTSITTGRPSQ